jgi:hypothetical protein
MFLLFRRSIVSISKKLSRVLFICSPKELWDLAVQEGLSRNFNACPFLFDVFLQLFISEELYAKARKNIETFNNIKKKYINKFYFFIMFATKIQGKRNNISLFWLTFSLQYYGCSNSGIRFLSKFGACLSDRHYRRIAQRKYITLKKELYNQIPQHHVVVWLDNYSRMLRTQIPTSKERSIPNFSAAAISFTPQLQINDYEFGLNTSWFSNTCKAIPSIINFGYYESTIYTVDRLTVPMRVSRKSYNRIPQHPVTILEYNCTSNKGLEDCLLYIFKEIPMNSIFTLKCDINIYWRLAKYFLDPQKSIITTKCIPFLGLWHIFKILIQKLFSLFAPIILVDCCFALKMASVPSLPKLPYALSMFLYLVPLIPDVVSWISNFLARNPNHKYKINLLNLYYLFNNLLPRILDFGYAISSGDFNLFINCLPSILCFLIELKCPSYCSSVYIFLSQLNHIHEVHGNFYEHLRNNFDAFIEEKNEILLSFLAQSVVNHSNKFEVSHLAKQFIMLGASKTVFQQIQDNCDTKSFGKEKVVYRRNELNPENIAIRSQLENIFIAIAAESWELYPTSELYRIPGKVAYYDMEPLFHNLRVKLDSLQIRVSKLFKSKF